MFTSDGQFSLQILVKGTPLAEYAHQGEKFVEGIVGREFTLRLSRTNRQRRALVVVSVDGLSIMSGKPASSNDRGYIIDGWSASIDIPGWRLNDQEIAAFYFASLPESYAAQMGKPANVGVIGAKFWYEKQPDIPEASSFEMNDYELEVPPIPAPMTALPPPPSPSGLPAPPAPPAPRVAPGYGTPSTPMSAPRPRTSGVGTGFGKRQDHRITTVSFDRDDTTLQTLALRYDTPENLRARGIVLLSDKTHGDRVMQANPFPGDEGCTPPPGWRG